MVHLPLIPPALESTLFLSPAARKVIWAAFTALVVWTATRVYRAGAVHGAGMNDVRGWFGGLFSRGKKAD